MKSAHLTEDNSTITPLGAAAVELATCRGMLLDEAVPMLQDMLENDCAVPVSGMFTPDQVVAFYRERGEEVNAVPLPRTR
jgi:hypothetical protein